MGKRSSSPPPAPDPTAVANAQGAANLQTAIAQGWLNALNQYGPYGSVTYDQIGTHRVGDQDVPQFAQHVNLSPEQQEQLRLQQQLQLRALGLGEGVLGNIEGVLNQPMLSAESFSADRDAVTQNIIARNRPMMDSRRASLENQLANQGIMRGSEAWRTALDDLSRQENDFNMSAINAGGAEQNRLFGLSQAARAQPFNEYAALLGYSGGINVPGAAYQSPQMAGVDVAGPMYNQYQGQLAGWNAQNQANQGMMGGLFGLGGSIAGALPWSSWLSSDKRMKQNIAYTGDFVGTIPLATFTYKGDPHKVKFVGVLAQDAVQVMPEAVEMRGGMMRVNYSMLGIELRALH